MFNNLLEKIDYEYEKYYTYIQLTSRSDYMSRAFEIAAKKAIYEKLLDYYNEGKFNTEQIEEFMNIDELIDVIYHKAQIKNLLVLTKNGEISEDSWKHILISMKF